MAMKSEQSIGFSHRSVSRRIVFEIRFDRVLEILDRFLQPLSLRLFQYKRPFRYN